MCLVGSESVSSCEHGFLVNKSDTGHGGGGDSVAVWIWRFVGITGIVQISHGSHSSLKPDVTRTNVSCHEHHVMFPPPFSNLHYPLAVFVNSIFLKVLLV